MPSLDEAKNLIKDTPISSVVGMYIPLNKKGVNYEAICPFHPDSHPSLKVNDSKGIFRCFVCETGGDAIKFTMLFNKQMYPDAIKDIAGKMGITVEEERKGKINPKLDFAMKVLGASNKIYRKYAIENRPKEFWDFVKKRNLNEESLSTFSIGFSPKNNAVAGYLATLPEEMSGKAIESAHEIGMIKDGKWGQYDFFRERVMFPIWDHFGKIRGYSSRATRDDQIPKYLNSGESFVFNKGHILYGFHLAKNEIRAKDSALLVEGNMDVVVLHQFGFKNAIGTMGIAISEKSMDQLLNLTSNIYLGMDSDPAGISAMEKINAMFMGKGILPKFIDFTPAKDPDEFLQEYGRLELTKRIDAAKSFLDYQLSRIIPETVPTASDAKMKLLESIFELLSPLGDNLIAKDQAIYAANRLGFNSTKEDIVTAYLKSLSSSNNKATPVIKPLVTTTKAAQQNISSREVLPKPKGLPKEIKKVLSTVVRYPETLNTTESTELLDLMGYSEVKQFIQWLKNLYLEIDDSEYGNVINGALSSEGYNQELCDVVTSTLFEYSNERIEKKVAEKMVGDLIHMLKEWQLKEKRLELKLKRKETLNQDESFAILKEIQSLEEKLSLLKNTKA